MTTATFDDQLSRVRRMSENYAHFTPYEQAALRAVLDAVPQWQDKPTSPGWWLIRNIRSGRSALAQLRFHSRLR